MAKYLVFLSEVSASPQTSCSSAFRLKDIHDKILQPKKIFQRDRVSDVVLVGFLSVFGFTFIHLLTTAERKNYAVEGSRCINLSAGMPMNRTFAERLKLLKDFWGHSSRVSIRPRACFSPSYNKVKSQTKHVWLLTLL
ncbi:hypothetical protein HKQ55_01100 [Bacteroides vulgatus]|uniref:Transmembrane protein n=2 Tax=Phocaeicola vulgatus TaxID=821 RepID=A0A848QR87_PHOVU|nr:hypothetical protein [Phocaeicola vulgatus]